MSLLHSSDLERQQHLETFLENNGYQLVQINGQRVITPISVRTSKLERGAEVFFANIPKDLDSSEVFALFLQVGPIVQMRVMVDFNGRNKGYGFCAYDDYRTADAAVRRLHQLAIRPGRRLVVSLSVDNRRLFVGNLPRDKSYEEVRNAMETYMEGITNVIMHKDVEAPHLNRGYVFVEFESHRKAYMARRKLFPGVLELWGHAISVDWADPVPIVNPDIIATVKVLYVKSVPRGIGDATFTYFLINGLCIEGIDRVKTINDYAFIHFVSRPYAESAFDKINGIRFGDDVLAVEWARPTEYSKQHRQNHLPDHYCSSMPPKIRQAIACKLKSKRAKTESSSSTSSESDYAVAYRPSQFRQNNDANWRNDLSYSFMNYDSNFITPSFYQPLTGNSFSLFGNNSWSLHAGVGNAKI